MTLKALHAKQSTRRQAMDLERIMRDEPTTIHPLARARGITQDDIAVGMPCTVKLARWVEGPAVITSFDRSKHGRVWRIRVRPDFQNAASRHERFWGFTLSDKPAIKLRDEDEVLWRLRGASAARRMVAAPSLPFFAYRHGSPDLNASIWQHRRLLVGHAEARDDRLTEAIVQARDGYVPRSLRKSEADLTAEDMLFYATLELAVTRFLTAVGYPANLPDTLDSLLGQADPPATDLRCP